MPLPKILPKKIDQETPEQADQELTEALEDLGAIYLQLYGTAELSRDVPKLHEDPEVIDGLQKIYEDFVNPMGRKVKKLNLEQDLAVLRELEEKYMEACRSRSPGLRFKDALAPGDHDGLSGAIWEAGTSNRAVEAGVAVARPQESASLVSGWS